MLSFKNSLFILCVHFLSFLTASNEQNQALKIEETDLDAIPQPRSIFEAALTHEKPDLEENPRAVKKPRFSHAGSSNSQTQSTGDAELLKSLLLLTSAENECDGSNLLPPFAEGTFHLHSPCLFAIENPIALNSLSQWLFTNAQYAGPLITEADIESAKKHSNCSLFGPLINQMNPSLLTTHDRSHASCLFSIFTSRHSITDEKLPSAALLPALLKTPIYGEAFLINFLFDKLIPFIPVFERREAKSPTEWSSLAFHMLLSKIVEEEKQLLTASGPGVFGAIDNLLSNLKTLHQTGSSQILKHTDKAAAHRIHLERKLEILRQMKIDDDVSFECGFDGTKDDSGHAMILVITRTANHPETNTPLYIAHIINGGYGMNVEGVITEQGRLKWPAVMACKGLSEEDLVNRHFFSFTDAFALFAENNINFGSDQIPFPQPQSYNDLIAGLNFKPSSWHLLTAGQEAGTCTTYSVKLMLRFFLGDELFKLVNYFFIEQLHQFLQDTKDIAVYWGERTEAIWRMVIEESVLIRKMQRATPKFENSDLTILLDDRAEQLLDSQAPILSVDYIMEHFTDDPDGFRDRLLLRFNGYWDAMCVCIKDYNEVLESFEEIGFDCRALIAQWNQSEDEQSDYCDSEDYENDSENSSLSRNQEISNDSDNSEYGNDSQDDEVEIDVEGSEAVDGDGAHLNSLLDADNDISDDPSIEVTQYRPEEIAVEPLTAEDQEMYDWMKSSLLPQQDEHHSLDLNDYSKLDENIDDWYIEQDQKK